MNELTSDSSKAFDGLFQVKCKLEKKGRFNYVSWTDAWTEVKKRYPGSNVKVYTREDGYPAFIHKTHGGFVKVGVIIDGIEHVEFYPILDHYNKTISSELINVFDINNAIKRGMVKAIAMHGLGLYVYAGEDLPQEVKE